MANENFKYGTYDPTNTPSGYFGKPETEASIDDQLASFGLIDEVKEEKKRGFIESIKESSSELATGIGEQFGAVAGGIKEGISKVGSDIRKFQEGTIMEEVLFDQPEGTETGILGNIFRAGLERSEALRERQAGREEEFGDISAGIETFGQGAGIIQDIIGEAFMSGLKTIATDKQEEAVQTGISEALQSPKGQEGIKALQEGIDSFEAFEDENPRIGSLIRTGSNLGLTALDIAGFSLAKQTGKQVAKQTTKQIDDVAVNITKAIKETPELIDTTALKSSLAKKAQRLERGAVERQREIAEEIALPGIKELGKRQKAQAFGDVIETGKGFGKKDVLVRNPREALAIEETANLLDSGKITRGMTPIKKRQVIEDEITNISRAIESDLRFSDIVIKKVEMENLFDDLAKQIIDNPAIVGDAESAIKKLLPQLRKKLNKDEFFPEDILQLRKDFDKAVRAAKGDKVFDPNLDNAFTTALRDFRQGLNKKVEDLVPDANVRRQLDRQSALFEVSKTLEDRFASQANSFVGRALSKIQEVSGVPRTEIVELVTGLGLAGVALPILAPLGAAVGVGAFGKEGLKVLTRPAMRRKLASILRKFDESIKANPTKAKEIKNAKQEFENLIDNVKKDVDSGNKSGGAGSISGSEGDIGFKTANPAKSAISKALNSKTPINKKGFINPTDITDEVFGGIYDAFVSLFEPSKKAGKSLGKSIPSGSRTSIPGSFGKTSQPLTGKAALESASKNSIAEIKKGLDRAVELSEKSAKIKPTATTSAPIEKIKKLGTIRGVDDVVKVVDETPITKGIQKLRQNMNNMSQEEFVKKMKALIQREEFKRDFKPVIKGIVKLYVTSELGIRGGARDKLVEKINDLISVPASTSGITPRG